MKNTLFLLFIFGFIFPNLTFAQHENFISVFGGKTFMGTGDISGFNLGFGYQHLIKKHFGFEANLRATSATMRNQFEPANTENANEGYNTEFRSTTSGYQLEVLASAPIINNLIKVNLLAGPVLRRQFNTLPNPYGVNYTQDYSTTILNLHYDRPLNTHSIGFSAQIEVSVKFLDKNYLGARLASHSYVGDLNWYFPIIYQRKF